MPMSPVTTNKVQKILTCDRLPLAIYREIVAHLQQVEGVSAQLTPQKGKVFDYLQSQVGGLSLEYYPAEDTEEQVNSILGYYAEKYGVWQSIS